MSKTLPPDLLQVFVVNCIYFPSTPVFFKFNLINLFISIMLFIIIITFFSFFFLCIYIVWIYTAYGILVLIGVYYSYLYRPLLYFIFFFFSSFFVIILFTCSLFPVIVTCSGNIPTFCSPDGNSIT